MQRAVEGVRDSRASGGRGADTKYSKDEVNYRYAGASSTKCKQCSHFAWAKGGGGAGVCEIVAGTVKPGAVCDRFESAGGGLADLITGLSS